MSTANTVDDTAGAAPSARHSLKKNALSLLVIQVANQALPVVTLPIVTRALGTDEFGRMSFVLGLIAYATLVSDYGFNLSATAAISVHRGDRAARSRIFWETIAVKALLAVACAAVSVIALPFLPNAAADRGLFAIGFGIVISGVFTPNWYFQGIERLPILSLITFVTRASAVPATLYFVRSPADTAIALTITVTAALSGAVISLATLWLRREVAFVAPSIAGLREALSDGWHVFISTAAISLYTNTNAVLLGLLASNQAVAFFVAADKVVKAAQLPLAPISQSLYPRISYLMTHRREEAYALIRRSARIAGGVALLISLGLLVLAPWIVRYLFGASFAPAIAVLQVLSALPVIVALSNLFGIQTMLPLGMKREFSWVLIGAGPINVVLLAMLAPRLGSLGAATSVVVTETIITTAMGVLLWRRDIPVFGSSRPRLRAHAKEEKP